MGIDWVRDYKSLEQWLVGCEPSIIVSWSIPYKRKMMTKAIIIHDGYQRKAQCVRPVADRLKLQLKSILQRSTKRVFLVMWKWILFTNYVQISAFWGRDRMVFLGLLWLVGLWAQQRPMSCEQRWCIFFWTKLWVVGTRLSRELFSLCQKVSGNGCSINWASWLSRQMTWRFSAFHLYDLVN